MKNRLKNWITSILGVGVVLFGAAGVWYEKFGPAWLVAFALVGLGLMYIKDPEWLKKVIEKIAVK